LNESAAPIAWIDAEFRLRKRPGVTGKIDDAVLALAVWKRGGLGEYFGASLPRLLEVLIHIGYSNHYRVGRRFGVQDRASALCDYHRALTHVELDAMTTNAQALGKAECST
jgi:hypothetical protein